MTVRVEHGDCREVIPRLVAEGLLVDAIITDPPYGLEFMGKDWDRSVPGVEFWKAALSILKPGGHLIAFGGTRTYHRMTCAIEDAGFEIRDAIMWHYGTGFPKSLNVSKAIDKAARGVPQGGVDPTSPHHGDYKTQATEGKRGAGDQGQGFGAGPGQFMRNDLTMKQLLDEEPRELTPEAQAWEGWGTALKPATEIICVARKPLAERTVAANVLKHGTGALNIDECRIEGEAGSGVWGSSNETIALDEDDRRTFNGSPDQRDYRSRPYRVARRNEESDENRKAYSKGLAGSQAAGTTTVGRWPANLAHDGSPEVMALFPDSAGQQVAVHPDSGTGRKTNGIMGKFATNSDHEPRGDTGSAARFFYSTKAGAEDRWGSKHPTVKPVKLIEWLITLVTRRGGLALDCFAGSGTAGVAALATGRNAILIEEDAGHIADIRERMAHYEGGSRHSLASKNRNAREKTGPLL